MSHLEPKNVAFTRQWGKCSENRQKSDEFSTWYSDESQWPLAGQEYKVEYYIVKSSLLS